MTRGEVVARVRAKLQEAEEDIGAAVDYCQEAVDSAQEAESNASNAESSAQEAAGQAECAQDAVNAAARHVAAVEVALGPLLDAVVLADVLTPEQVYALQAVDAALVASAEAYGVPARVAAKVPVVRQFREAFGAVPGVGAGEVSE